jgi:uncharacterized repeat protein (TIGR03803 family)
LHSFDGTDGKLPIAGLVQDTNGNLYGTTLEGGANDDGTVFGLSVGPRPFVETNPTSGTVGLTVHKVGALGEPAGEIGCESLERLLQSLEACGQSAHVERGHEAVNQSVALLVRLDQPQGHPLRTRVKIEDPSL